MLNCTRRVLIGVLSCVVFLTTFLANSPSIVAEGAASSSNKQVKIKKMTAATNAVYALDSENRIWSIVRYSAGYRPNVLKFFRDQPIQDLKTDSGHLLVLLKDGTVWKHSNTEKQEKLFEQIPGLQDVTSIHANGSLSYAMTAEGTVWRFSPYESSEMVRIEGIRAQDVVQFDDTYVVKTDGTVWDLYPYGKGDVPEQIEGLTNIKKVVVGNTGSTTYALTQDGEVWGWGFHRSGELSLDGLSSSSEYLETPLHMENLHQVKDIMAGNQHFAVIKEDGSVWAWGLNQLYQLGDGTKKHSSIPVLIQQLDHVEQLVSSSSLDETFAIFSDGTVKAWGSFEDCFISFCDQVSISTPTVIRFPPPLHDFEDRFTLQYSGKKGSALFTQASDNQGNIVIVGEKQLIVSHNYGQTWENEQLPFVSYSRQLSYVHDRFYLWSNVDSTEVYTSKDGRVWTKQVITVADEKHLSITNISWTNKQFIALLSTDFETKVYTSMNGASWQLAGTVKDTMQEIVWNGKRYTAFGGGYEIHKKTGKNQFQSSPHDKGKYGEIIVYTSDNLTSWTHQSGAKRAAPHAGFNVIPVKNYYYQVWEVDKNGVIVLLDMYDNMLTSQDGITFNLKKSPSVFYKEDIHSQIFWNGRQYLVYTSSVRGEANVQVSTDQVHWKQQKISNIPVRMNVVKSGQTFVGITESGIIATSQDGLNWKIKRSASFEASLYEVQKFNNRYMAVGTEISPAILTSNDGQQWKSLLQIDYSDYSASRELKSVAWSGTTYVAVGGELTWISKDGVTWKKTGKPLTDNQFTKVIWTGKQFLASANTFTNQGKQSKTILYTSTDGQSWKRALEWRGQLYDLAAHGGIVLAVGTNNKQAVIVRSTNLKDWKTQTFTLGKDSPNWNPDPNDGSENYAQAFMHVQWVNNRFTLLSDHIYTSTDGITWSVIKGDYSEYVSDRYDQASVVNGRILWTGKDYRYYTRSVLAVSKDLTDWEFYELPDEVYVLKDMIWTGRNLLGVGEDGLIVHISDR